MMKDGAPLHEAQKSKKAVLSVAPLQLISKKLMMQFSLLVFLTFSLGILNVTAASSFRDTLRNVARKTYFISFKRIFDFFEATGGLAMNFILP